MNTRPRLRLLGWAAMLLCAAAVLAGLRGLSTHYLSHRDLPAGAEGAIDLAGVDFTQTPYLPLSQGWLFYPDSFLVSDYTVARPEARAVSLPGRIDGVYRGSYQLQIQNFPADISLCVYIPGQNTQYRIYWNQYLVTSNQTQGSGFSGGPIQLNRLPIPYNYRGNLVIEVESASGCAIDAAPVLTTAQHYNRSLRVNNTVVGLSYGAMIFCLLLYGAMWTIGKNFRSAPLMGLLVLCLGYCTVRSSADNIVGYLLPAAWLWNRYAAVALSAAVPLMLLYNAQQMARPLKPWLKAASLCIALLGAALKVLCLCRPVLIRQLRPIGALLWYGGALLPLGYLGLCAWEEKRYALVLTAAELCLLLGLSVDRLSASGLLVYGVTLWFPLLFVATLLLLFFLYLDKIITLQRQARRAQENEIAMVKLRLENQQSEAALMLSQMRPHFLYNALLSIYDVNLENHEKANQAIIQFANYLRGNLLSIESKGPIPFSRELQHIENYVAIEKLRFEDRLDMRYDIGYRDFSLPPLTVQPFVENAIKHGICKRLSGGWVLLRTWQDPEGAVHILVQDNGVGFPTERAANPDSIGIRNVRTRLRTIPGAQVTLNSTPGQGTTVEITLPKEASSCEHDPDTFIG